MCLLEETPEAEAMRQNVVRLIESGIEADFVRAYQMIQGGGGMHKSFVMPIAKSPFIAKKVMAHYQKIKEQVLLGGEAYRHLKRVQNLS